MPNSTQRALLDSFIGEEGIYFETIRDDEAFNLGTKVLYLERAISQNCQTFLQSLDKLYNPSLNGAAKIANLEFIRALKLINDFCFNNQVKYGQFGTREALTHYFRSLGDVDANDFQITMIEIIGGGIATLRQDHEAEIAAQATVRATEEEGIVRQTGWRGEVDLPQDQLAQMDHEHHHAFFQQMPPVPQVHLIPVRIQILIQAGVIAQGAAAALSREQLDKLVCTQPLISNGRMSVEDALALTGMQHLCLGEERIFTLIQEDRLTVDQAKALSREQIDNINLGNEDEVLHELGQQLGFNH